ncbi:hypothetical protein cyc_04808 [Cyclospora cayetanensis]|uniref:Uncharacterized protein n=1 Tax=Cyclospora cayetanensis TaxID=88456 RepID=A0A1D3CW36_9EIME|nr:hypothetical protein cyc_04808 [Cyclospora cayetanensis]
MISALHHMWARCCTKSISLTPGTLFALPPDKAEAILKSVETPVDFSQQMTKDIDPALIRFTESGLLYPSTPPADEHIFAIFTLGFFFAIVEPLMVLLRCHSK